MKREGGREAGKYSMMVSDRGGRCLFVFFSFCGRLLFNTFPFPFSKA
jgi:hypothetical protein